MLVCCKLVVTIGVPVDERAVDSVLVVVVVAPLEVVVRVVVCVSGNPVVGFVVEIVLVTAVEVRSPLELKLLLVVVVEVIGSPVVEVSRVLCVV